MPLGAYNSTFDVTGETGTPFGFDVEAGGYGDDIQADVNIRKVPWGTTVVVQGTGWQPTDRIYRVIFYTMAQYFAFQGLVGKTGTLLTPRQGTPGAQAVLVRVQLTATDRSTPAGPLKATLSFKAFLQ